MNEPAVGVCSETDAETDTECDNVGTTGESHFNRIFLQRNSTELELDLFSEPAAVFSATRVRLHLYASLKLKIKLMRRFFKDNLHENRKTCSLNCLVIK